MTTDPIPHESVSVEVVSTLLDLIVADDAADASIHRALATQHLGSEAGERLAQQAGQVRSSFRRWRRREQELSAILSGVRELAELRDVDTLLERIVDRARQLLGADVAYLTGHHDNALRVRTTSGVVAPELRELVVPVGVKLADAYSPSDKLADEIRAHVRARLATYEYPREVEFIDELPMTTTGKVRRNELRSGRRRT